MWVFLVIIPQLQESEVVVVFACGKMSDIVGKIKIVPKILCVLGVCSWSRPIEMLA